MTVTRALTRLGLHPPGDAPFPRPVRPMLANLAQAPFNDPAWVYEPKWDGFRIIAMIHDGSVRLFSRNLHSFTNLFGPVADDLRGFPTSLVLDGEVVALTKRGVPDFEALQGWLRPRMKRPRGRLAYMIFDCVYVNGHSLLNRTLEDRQAALRALRHALSTETIRVTEAFSGVDGRFIFRECAKLGLEGAVAKRSQSIYRPGIRSKDWIKIPVRRRDEFVVGGYMAPSRNHLSTLIVGQHDRAGKLRYAGLVGTGLSEETRRVILRELQATPRKMCPFTPVPVLRDHFGELRTDLPPRWVRPALVAVVEYKQRISDGLRHAVLRGIRPEKDPHEVRSLNRIIRGARIG